MKRSFTQEKLAHEQLWALQNSNWNSSIHIAAHKGNFDGLCGLAGTTSIVREISVSVIRNPAVCWQCMEAVDKYERLVEKHDRFAACEHASQVYAFYEFGGKRYPSIAWHTHARDEGEVVWFTKACRDCGVKICDGCPKRMVAPSESFDFVTPPTKEVRKIVRIFKKAEKPPVQGVLAQRVSAVWKYIAGVFSSINQSALLAALLGGIIGIILSECRPQ